MHLHLRLPFRLDPDTFSALKSKDFTIFLAGQSAAMTGVWVQKLANSWLVYRLTESPLKLGFIELLANAPIFIVGLLAGAYLEQHDKRKTLMLTQFLTMLHAVIMAVLVFTNNKLLFYYGFKPVSWYSFSNRYACKAVIYSFNGEKQKNFKKCPCFAVYDI